MTDGLFRLQDFSMTENDEFKKSRISRKIQNFENEIIIFREKVTF